MPPFSITFDYEVKDWLTNELNIRDSEVNFNENDVFVKIPVGNKTPMSVNITSISEKPMSIKNVDMDIVATDLICKISKGQFDQVDNVEQEDTI